jgi:Skp family chaperone for outer membrane proteins
METSTEYRRFAQECRRLAQEAKTERHRKIMEEMAQAWERLAKEADLEGAHASL